MCVSGSIGDGKSFTPTQRVRKLRVEGRGRDKAVRGKSNKKKTDIIQIKVDETEEGGKRWTAVGAKLEYGRRIAGKEAIENL